jgi:hypothetical protein
MLPPSAMLTPVTTGAALIVLSAVVKTRTGVHTRVSADALLIMPAGIPRYCCYPLTCKQILYCDVAHAATLTVVLLLCPVRH